MEHSLWFLRCNKVNLQVSSEFNLFHQHWCHTVRGTGRGGGRVSRECSQAASKPRLLILRSSTASGAAAVTSRGAAAIWEPASLSGRGSKTRPIWHQRIRAVLRRHPATGGRRKGDDGRNLVHAAPPKNRRQHRDAGQAMPTIFSYPPQRLVWT